MAPRIRFPMLGVLTVILLSGVAACDRELHEPRPSLRPASPVEEPWFRHAFAFLDRMHLALQDPGARVELRLQLLAEREEWALRRMGIEAEELAGLYARLELLRPELEARWPELAQRSLPGGEGSFRESLLELLQAQEWPKPPGEASKLPEYVCAAYELYENLAHCVSYSPYVQAFCMYQAYLRYLHHLNEGCGG